MFSIAHRIIVRAAVLALVLLAAAPESASGPRRRPTSRESSKRAADRLVRRLLSDDPAVRKAAERTLTLMRARAVPLLVKHLHDRDTRLVRGVQDVLQKIEGTPGEAVEGLTLSAIPAGPAPAKGEAIALWLTVRNTTRSDIFIFSWLMELAARPPGAAGAAFEKKEDEAEPRRFWAPKGETPGRKLAPGQSFGFVMDADPSDPAAAAKIAAHLKIYQVKPGVVDDDDVDFPENMRPFNIQPFEIVAAPVTISYAPERKVPLTDYERLLRDWLKDDTPFGLDGWGVRVRDSARDKKMIAAKPDADALRRALRSGKTSHRWRAFHLICRQARGEMAEDVVDFALRWGPGAEIGFGVLRFGKAFAQEERFAFFYRVAMVRRGIGYTGQALASDYMSSVYFPNELAWVTRMLLLEPAENLSRPQRHFVAWQLFANPNPEVHDAKRALAIATKLAAEPLANERDAFILAIMKGKKDEARRIAAGIDDPGDCNNMAWTLAIAGRPEAQDNKLAIRLAQKAVDGLDEDDEELAGHIDTLACAYATAGDYDAAARFMQKALEADASGPSREIFARRLVRFIGMAKTDPKERRQSPNGIAGAKARDALLAKLESTDANEIRRAVAEVLEESFAGDPVVEKALKAGPPKNDK